MSASVIARRAGGTLRGHNWSLPCPICGYDLLLADGEDGRLLTWCRGECEYEEIRAALVQYGSLDGGDDGLTCYGVPPVARPRTPDAVRSENARHLYNALGPGGVVVRTYLHQARGSTLPTPSILRFGMCPHRIGGCYPAMAAPITDVDGKQIGIHMTYLRQDGRGKAEFGDPKLQRETRGVLVGGSIRLMPYDPKRALGIGEGIETSLAGAEIFGLPAWSAVYAGGIKTVELPPEIRAIVIFADHDASGVGWRNAQEAYWRWIAGGRHVRIVMPPTVGDFNDILMKRGVQ